MSKRIEYEELEITFCQDHDAVEIEGKDVNGVYMMAAIDSSMYLEAIPKIARQIIQFNPEREIELIEYFWLLGSDLYNERQEKKKIERIEKGQIRKHNQGPGQETQFKRRHE